MGLGILSTSRHRAAGRKIAAAALLVLAITLPVAGLLGGCATVGHDFPTGRVADIRLNETTQVQIRAMFGEPWRTGIEDGRPTWTYGKYRYKLFGQAETEDLVIRFDEQGRVASYTFNTTKRAAAPAKSEQAF